MKNTFPEFYASLPFTFKSSVNFYHRSEFLIMLNFFRTPSCETESIRLELNNPCLISDLHLDIFQEKDLRSLRVFLNEQAASFDELVILGDFFDYWVGDDSIKSAIALVDLLRGFSKSHRVFLMHGNRDFMIGQQLAKHINARLITDPCLAHIGKAQYLLSHGDLWCTQDSDYQRVRARVRSFWWQWLVLRLPLSKRLAIAQNARKKSQYHKNDKSAEMMDVVADSVLRSCTPDTVGVIHGHTHRPGRIQLTDTLNRWVIPDWRTINDDAVSYTHLTLPTT